MILGGRRPQRTVADEPEVADAEPAGTEDDAATSTAAASPADPATGAAPLP